MQGISVDEGDVRDPNFVFGDDGPTRRRVSRDELMSFIHTLLVRARSHAVARITIRNIETDFELDLSNMGDASGPFPRLFLQNCAMPSLRAQFSHFVGVTVSDCDMDSVDLSESRIEFEINVINQNSAGRMPVRLVNTICSGAIVIDNLSTSLSRSENVAVSLYGARAHNVNIANIRDGASLDLSCLKTEINVRISKCLLHPNPGGSALVLEQIDVGGSLNLWGCTVLGTMLSTNIGVGGILSFRESEFRVKSGPWLSFNRAIIGGSIQFDSVRATGQVRILSAEIAGNFRVSESQFTLPVEQKERHIFDCHRINLLGEIRFDRETSTTGGGIRFGSCTMAQLLVTECSFGAHNDGHYVFAVIDSNVASSAQIKQSKANGHFTIQNCEMQTLEVHDLEFSSQDQAARETAEVDFDLIDLTRSTIGKVTLLVGTLSTQCSKIYVDLYDATIGRLDIVPDGFYRSSSRPVTLRDVRRNLREQGGWWRLKFAAAAPFWAVWQLLLRLFSERPDSLGNCLFNLERCSFGVMPASIGDRAFLRMRRAFSRYNMLRGRLPAGATLVDFAKYLRRIGQSDIAERIMLKSRRFHAANEGRPHLRLSYWLFDALFGYGYSKLRATLTLAAWILLGALGIQKALDGELLVLDSQVVASTIIPATGTEGMRPGMPVLAPDAGNDRPIPCRGAVDLALLAIDLIIPIHDFGQAKICTLKPVEDVAKGAMASDPLALWWIGRHVYTIGGWIIVSLVVLTFTGSLKTRLPE